MRLPLLVSALLLLACESALTAAPTFTVQIADVRDASGVFTSWTVLTVTWDATALTAVPDHHAWTTKSSQAWAAYDGASWWGFAFTRSKIGEYAIRYCLGTATADSIWSEPEVSAILRVENPRAR